MSFSDKYERQLEYSKRLEARLDSMGQKASHVLGLAIKMDYRDDEGEGSSSVGVGGGVSRGLSAVESGIADTEYNVNVTRVEDGESVRLIGASVGNISPELDILQ